jgi:hypothetical protein
MSTPPASATHRLGPIAAKTVEAIRRHPDSLRKHMHAVIAVEGEARSALQSLAAGYLTHADLEGRLRDILAICEATRSAS